MLTHSNFIEWITQRYPQAKYNLAASGIPALSTDEAAMIPMAAVNDPYRSLCSTIADIHGVNADEVAACNGASQAMWLAYVALLHAGDEVLVEQPTYAPFIETPVSTGVRVRRFLRERSENFALDPDRICRAISPKTRVVAFTDLHNPSGVRAGKDAVREIAAQLRRQNGYVIIDEVYSPFDRTSDAKGIACRTSRHLASNIIAVSSLSKGFGLGLHRIGWVIGPREIVDRARVALRASTGDLSPTWAAFAIGAASRLPWLSARAERLLGRKRERVQKWVAERHSLDWSPPTDGLFALVNVRGARDLRPTIEAGLARHGVITVPGSFFEVPDAFRIAWALPEACLDEALERLDAVLRDSHLL